MNVPCRCCYGSDMRQSTMSHDVNVDANVDALIRSEKQDGVGLDQDELKLKPVGTRRGEAMQCDVMPAEDRARQRNDSVRES